MAYLNQVVKQVVERVNLRMGFSNFSGPVVSESSRNSQCRSRKIRTRRDLLLARWRRMKGGGFSRIFSVHSKNRTPNRNTFFSAEYDSTRTIKYVLFLFFEVCFPKFLLLRSLFVRFCRDSVDEVWIPPNLRRSWENLFWDQFPVLFGGRSLFPFSASGKAGNDTKYGRRRFPDSNVIINTTAANLSSTISVTKLDSSPSTHTREGRSA